MASRMCLREAPRSQGFELMAPEHLVATTKSSRRPRSHRPSISSVRPTVSNVPPSGYTSAVSRKVIPPAAARSRMATEAGSSHCRPKVMVPRQRQETERPVRPSRTWRMGSESNGDVTARQVVAVSLKSVGGFCFLIPQSAAYRWA